MNNESRKYTSSNPAELLRDIYKKFGFGILVKLMLGELIVTEKPKLETPTSEELSLFEQAPVPESSLFVEGIKTPQPKVIHILEELGEEDRLRPFNPCVDSVNRRH